MKTRKKTLALSTPASFAVLAAMLALAALLIAGLFTLTTHTLAVLAVALLIFRVDSK